MCSHAARWLPKLCVTLLLSAAFLAVPADAASDDVRFSATLSDAQRAETGLAQLTEDNIAVIDALVRQDEATLKRRGSLGSFGAFSQRRSENEKEIAGFSRLTPAQLERLDGLTGIRISPPPPMLVSETKTRKATPGVLVRPVERPYALEVHGSVSLTYGWSKAGSTRGGEMVVNLQDPAHRFSLSVGYSEYRGKGLSPLYDPADDSYRYRSTSEAPLDRY
ncbi:MAG: hypothetical protein ABIZ81_04720 [Opitutaceae bacterium]